jgi:hypothetical protein
MYKDELRKDGEKSHNNILEISFIFYKNTKVGPVNSKK